MTKERLEQIILLKNEIQQQKQRLKELEKEYHLTAKNLRREKESLNQISFEVQRKALELKQTMEQNLLRLLEEREVLFSYIVKIEDSQMRQIFALRYEDGLTWQQVAFKMGESDESYPRRKHNRYLKQKTPIIYS